MKDKSKILAVLLLVSILIGMFPINPIQIHASGWEECVYCGEGRSEDYLCSGCGGCGGVLEGSSCWNAHHCPTCGDCFDDMDGRCEDCWRCESCVPNMCVNGHCTDCVGFDEFCESCNRCAYCMEGCYCDDHHVCEGCAQFCSESGCLSCEDCVDIFCADCGKCQICAHDYFCENCETCSEHWDARCSNCHYCSNCAEVCSGCEDYCSECSLVCSGCGKCEDCIGDDVCQDCGICSDCGTLCSNCGNYCSDCADSFCDTCGTCSDCTDICINCGNACSDCSDMCGGCGEYCSDCADICQECGEACEFCGNMCPDCYEVCSDCVPFCKGCDECQNCRGDFCSRCEEYCSSCADFCEDCGACEYCVDICINCGDYCSTCKEICPGCGYCEECADICELCGEHCSNCEDWPCEFCDISTSCGHHAYCDLCSMCLSDPEHLVCPDCGEHVSSHWTRKSIDENFHQIVCNCGKLFGELQAHSIAYEVIMEATETEEGLGQYYCTYRKNFGCPYHKEVTIPALTTAHECDYDLWLPSWNGHKKMCACGETEGNNLAHEFETIILEEATDHKNGLGYDQCTVCGYSGNPYTIPATNHNHNYSDTWTYDNSHHWHECACGDKIDEGWHTMEGWLTTKYPTSTSAGSRERSCTVCDFKEIGVIPALVDQVVVSFDSQGGSPVENKTINNGSKVDKPTDPTKEGHDFIGWYTSTDYINEWKFGNSVYEYMTLYAKWEIDTNFIFGITIQDDGNGTGSANPASGTVGTEINLSYTANEGYKFKAWQVVSGGVSIIGNKFIMPANAVVVRATFEEIGVIPETYAVTINDSYASTTGAGNYEKGTIVNIYAGSRSGYNFNGWTSFEGVIFANANSASTTFIMPDKPVILTATWKPRSTSSGGGGSSTTTETEEPKDIVGPGDQKLPFEDVKEDSWSYDAVKYVYENDLMKGTGDNTFSPNEVITRGMIVTIIHRLEGLPIAKENRFTDVKADKYYADAVAWASENEIVNGYGNAKFGPEDPVTREQLAVILMNYAEYKGYDISDKADLAKYEDFREISNWAIDAISWADAEGLIQGDGNNLMPRANSTRAQVATILKRFMKNIEL